MSKIVSEFVSFTLLVVMLIAFCIALYFNKQKDEQIVLLNKEIEFYKSKAEQGYRIDSLNFNIIKQDSIINETKKAYIYEIELVEANNDIDAVAQFKELIGAE